MKNNLLSIWKLFKKNYKVSIEEKITRVLDSGGRLILKAPMSQNKTLRIEINVMEHNCLATATSMDEWI